LLSFGGFRVTICHEHMSVQASKSKKLDRGKTLHVSEGNTVVRIYKGGYAAKGAKYQQFTVSYHEGGTRIRKTFHSYEEARQEAEKIANRLEQGHRQALRLTNADAELFALAKREVARAGVPLLEAVRQFNAAMDALPEGASLLEAAREYAKRNRDHTISKTVSEVLDEFFEAKRQDGAAQAYLRTLRYHLNPIRERFRTPISSVTSGDMDTWIRTLGHSNRTRKNVLVSLTTLFRFARGRGYLPKNTPTEVENVTRPKVKSGIIGILTPDQLRTILHAADTDDRRIYFALGAFTGIRAAELSRLEWRDIDIKRRHVEITAAKAKTASRRLVPICDSLNAWLAPFCSKSGPVFTSQRSAERLVEWAGNQIGGWPKNALRHSFVSYRVAQTQNVAQVALEAGNSPQMIFANYRELVTKEAADLWFSIMPKPESK
jgi:integrase